MFFFIIYTSLKHEKKYHINGKILRYFTKAGCLSYDLTNLVCRSPNYNNHSGFDYTSLCILGFTSIRTYSVSHIIYVNIVKYFLLLITYLSRILYNYLNRIFLKNVSRIKIWNLFVCLTVCHSSVLGCELLLKKKKKNIFI